MPYYSKGKCVYKKNTNRKVGCTKGPVKDYLSALYGAENKKEITESTKFSLEVGPKLQFIKNKTTLKGLDENLISLRYKVKSEKNVELEIIYKIDKESILSLTKKEALKKEMPSVEEIEKFVHFEHCTLTDYNNVTQKGVTPGITSADLEDFVGKYNLTNEDLEYINGIEPLERIRNYFVDMVKVVKKKVIGIEESFEFEKLFDKVLNS